MSYGVEFLDDSGDELAALTSEITKRILKKIRWLANNGDSLSHEPLRANIAGLFKRRVGDYRVIYSLDLEEKTITIRKVGHRSNIYK